MHSLIIEESNYKVIDLKKEYQGDSPFVGDITYAIVTDLSEEDLASTEEVKVYAPFVVISPAMYEAMQESFKNNERERIRIIRKHDVYAIDDDSVATTYISPVAAAMSNYTLTTFLNEIMGLPSLQGRRLYQHCILGYSVESIAKKDGVGTSTVYESIKKAKNAIRKVFDDEEVVAK